MSLPALLPTHPRRRLPLVALALLATSACVHRQGSTANAVPHAARSVPASEAGFNPVASVEGITEYRLANGLRVLLLPDPSSATAFVSITYLVGSRHEGYGEAGTAHLLEHLLFRGTTRFPHPALDLEARGAVFNGETHPDSTIYYATLGGSFTEDLRWTLDMEADRMLNLVISREALELEKSVVRNELSARENDPASIVEERVRSTAYLWHNYGHPAAGAASDIEHVTPERVQAFYRAWYRPDNAVLLIAGDLDEAGTLRAVAETFGRLPRPEEPLPVTYTREPTQDGERSVTLRRDGGGPYVAAAWHVPGAAHPDMAALDVLASVLGDEPSGRIYRSLVPSRLAVSTKAAVEMGKERSILMATAAIRAGSRITTAEQRLISVVEGSATTRLGAENLERARRRLLASYEVTTNDTETLTEALPHWIARGDWRLLFLHRDRIRDVTAEDVTRVARAYLLPANRTSGVFVPTRDPERAVIPEPPDLEQVLAGYRGAVPVEPGEILDTAPRALEARTVRKDLANGIALAALRKKTRGDVVFFRMNLDLGNEGALKGRLEAAELCGGLLMRGTLRHSRQEIEDRLDLLQASLMVEGGAESASVTLDVPREHFAEALRVAAEILREPAFPADELELYRQEWLDAVESSRTDPRILAEHALARHLQHWPTDHPRYEPTPDEYIARIRALTTDDARSFHREFYGASRAQVGLVGDIAPEEVEALVTTLFGDWESRQRYQRIVEPFHRTSPLRWVLETPDKAAAVFQAATPVEVTDSDPDYAALVLGDILTGGTESSRLWRRIRDREGLSYGVESSLTVDTESPSGLFTVTATAEPATAERVERAVVDELGRILREGFDAAELARARETWVRQRHLYWAQDDLIADDLVAQTMKGRTFHHAAALEEQVAALTPEAVRTAMERHVSPDRLTVVMAGDFAATRRVAVAADAH